MCTCTRRLSIPLNVIQFTPGNAVNSYLFNMALYKVLILYCLCAFLKQCQIYQHFYLYYKVKKNIDVHFHPKKDNLVNLATLL